MSHFLAHTRSAHPASPRRRPLRLRAALTTFAAVAALAGASSPAEAQELRFSTTAPGGIASTGNTLGLSKASLANGPGTAHSIGTFITLDPTSVDDFPLAVDNPWPLGTTDDWSQNGSTGVLDLPAESEVLYAELVWAGSHGYGTEDVSPDLDEPVTLSFGGQTLTVSPDAATALTLDEEADSGFDIHYYIRSAEVTAFVDSHGPGTYAVTGVPATQGTTIDTLNAAGWSLVVAYRNGGEPIRNLSVFVGGSFVDEDTVQDYTVEGFCAPPFGTVEGSVVISAVEGDANLTGDQLAIAPTATDTFVALFGPNNPESNFFCSQLNDNDGMLDTRGSFGEMNHDAESGVNVSGGRQGWDLTTIALSSEDGHLFNNDKSAVIRTTTSGDSFLPTLVALALDVKSPDFSNSITQASVTVVQVDDQLTVTASLTNSGEAAARDLLFKLPLDAGLELLDFTLDGVTGDAGGQPVAEAALGTGVDVGVLEVGATRQVVLTLRVIAPPTGSQQFDFVPTWGHSFQVCDDQNPIAESFAAPKATVFYQDDVTPDPTTTTGTGTGGGAVDPGDDRGIGIIEEDGSCACTAPGRADGDGGLRLLAGLGIAALAASRRRRR